MNEARWHFRDEWLSILYIAAILFLRSNDAWELLRAEIPTARPDPDGWTSMRPAQSFFDFLIASRRDSICFSLRSGSRSNRFVPQ